MSAGRRLLASRRDRRVSATAVDSDRVVAVEVQVAQLAHIILTATALAERYDRNESSRVPDQRRDREHQERLGVLLTAAARGRQALVTLGHER